MEYFKNLHVDITLEILTRVPTESVSECKSVCKSWNQLVSHHPLFKKMHLHHLNHPSDSGKLGFIAVTRDFGSREKFHYIEYNENHDQSATPIARIRRFNFILPIRNTTYLGSCNGLICFVQYYSVNGGRTCRPFCICNPITKECIMLPEIKIDCSDTTDSNIYWNRGFGYVSSTNEYKAVAIRMSRKPQFVEVHVYSLGSGSRWRNLGKFNFAHSIAWGAGYFANGALYWRDFGLGMIFTFDLAEEKFSELLSPPPLQPDSKLDHVRMGVLDGILYFAIGPVDKGAKCYHDIWLLRKKKDNHDMNEPEKHQSLGWSKEFKVDSSKVLAVTKSGNVLTYTNFYLNIHNTIALTSETLVESKERLCDIFPHKTTLISLKELGEEDTKIMESMEIQEKVSHDQPLKKL